jgi:hypothetical protein
VQIYSYKRVAFVEHDEHFLIQAIQIFAQKYAKTRILRPVEIQTHPDHEGMIHASGMLQPYNDADTDRVYVWLTGTKAVVQVAGQGATEDSETQGFTQKSHKGDVDVTHMDAAKFAHAIFELTKKMR